MSSNIIYDYIVMLYQYFFIQFRCGKIIQIILYTVTDKLKPLNN